MTPHGGSRPGAGRPRKVDDPARITVDLPKSVHLALWARANDRGISLSELLREILGRSARR